MQKSCFASRNNCFLETKQFGDSCFWKQNLVVSEGGGSESSEDVRQYNKNLNVKKCSTVQVFYECYFLNFSNESKLHVYSSDLHSVG